MVSLWRNRTVAGRRRYFWIFELSETSSAGETPNLPHRQDKQPVKSAKEPKGPENSFLHKRFPLRESHARPQPSLFANRIGNECERSPRRLLNSLARLRLLPPDIRAFGDFLCHRSEPDWLFQEKSIHPLLLLGGADL
jgi:hypothetical protein